MKVKQIVSFNKESFFNGAVQTEWFYDDSKVGVVAESYVFHGPKYYGVSDSDVSTGEHRLIDTASFAKNIADKLYTAESGGNFIMTIAGYGTGKSHLAVCLGALFSGRNGISNTVAENISSADKEIGEYIKSVNTKKNLVIVLNGMNNFNLDVEVLRCARLSLARFGVSDKSLQKLTKSYNIARHFVDNMFQLFENKFNIAAQNSGLNLSGIALKNYLTSHVESDNKVIEIINTVYETVNGDKISWERGLSAGDVLFTLQKELCGENKPFNKILLLFDEFGRYIEYTAANPTIAGDAALQQVFEAVQNAEGKIIFTGFIQDELDAYLKRIEKTANITRYIERYRTACENLFLSSNFETILANTIKKDETSFDRVIGNAVGHYSNYHSKMQSALSRWDRSAVKKSVWITNDLYKSVILKGCYPLHPIAVWLLSRSYQWMQQRSTLAFVSEMFEQISDSDIEGAWLPYIYPVQLIDSGIFNEMLNSEEKGLVSSQYCMLYRDILVKIGDKLSDLEKIVLKAVLVINMGKMSFLDKDDAIMAIRYCSNLSEDEIKYALKTLEEMHGVVAFDDHSKTFDLIAEANGFNEFKRIFAKYRLGIKSTIEDLDEAILVQTGITLPVETSFGQDNQISSTEWGFSRRIVDIGDLSEGYLKSTIRSVQESCDGEKLRGVLIYAYCHKNIENEVARVSKLYKDLSLNKYPIIILYLNDFDEEILGSINIKKALNKFSISDKERFKKHILDQQRTQDIKIIRKFTNSVAQRLMITDLGVESYSGRINSLCTQCFTRLYTKTVPFPFDGFENKVKTQAKSTLTSICVGLLNHTLMNVQVYSSLTPKDKNRVSAVMSTKSTYSWKIFDENCRLVEPLHPIINNITKDVIHELENGEQINVSVLFGKYLLAPYGLNDNSLALLVSYFIAYQGNKYLYTVAGDRLSEKHWVDSKGKLKLPEIRKICIQKNANVGVDLVSNMCKKILETNLVEQCSSMKEELEILLKQEGETNENKLLVAQAKIHLDEGIRLGKIIYDKTDKIQTVLNEAKQKFSIFTVAKALENIPSLSHFIEEGSPFIYSNKYIELVGQLRSDLRKIIEQSYLGFIQKTKCEITQLSQFKNTYVKIIRILRDNGFEKYAVATEIRIREVEEELLAKQHYDSSLIECEKDLTFSNSANKYNECEELRRKLNTWILFFSGAKDLPKTISAPLIAKIDEAISLINIKLERIDKDYHDTVATVYSAKTIVDLHRVYGDLERMLQLQLPGEWESKIVTLQGSVDKAITYINTLPKELDAIEKIIAQIPEKEHPDCIAAIKNSALVIRSELKKEENAWIEKYISSVEKSYQNMSPYECTTWLEKTKTLPACLGAESKNRYIYVHSLIENQLHSARVEGLITMYNALTCQEKEDFRRRLFN